MKVYELVTKGNLRKFEIRNEEAKTLTKFDLNDTNYDIILMQNVVLKDGFHKRKLGYLKVDCFYIKGNSVIVYVDIKKEEL